MSESTSSVHFNAKRVNETDFSFGKTSTTGPMQVSLVTKSGVKQKRNNSTASDSTLMNYGADGRRDSGDAIDIVSDQEYDGSSSETESIIYDGSGDEMDDDWYIDEESPLLPQKAKGQSVLQTRKALPTWEIVKTLLATGIPLSTTNFLQFSITSMAILATGHHDALELPALSLAMLVFNLTGACAAQGTTTHSTCLHMLTLFFDYV